MNTDKEARQQQSWQSLSQALLLKFGGPNEPGPIITSAPMSPDERRAHLVSVIELALAAISDAEASLTSESNKDENDVQTHQ
jgi:hypothetical protein